MNGHALASYVAGVSGRVEIEGSPETIDATLEGNGRFYALELDTKDIKLNQSVLSRVTLGGRAEKITAELEGSAKLYAYDLFASEANIKASGYSRAEVNGIKSLKAIARDSGRISYKGNPPEIIKKESGGGSVEASDDIELDDLSGDDGELMLRIKTDSESYSPFMSSIRGIGLTPDYVGPDSVRFVWRTNGGYLVGDWANTAYRTQLTNDGEKIYWTFLPDSGPEKPELPIYVEVEVLDNNTGEILDDAKIEFDWTDDGGVTIKR